MKSANRKFQLYMLLENILLIIKDEISSLEYKPIKNNFIHIK
jgi:hypothetical protein